MGTTSGSWYRASLEVEGLVQLISLEDHPIAFSHSQLGDSKDDAGELFILVGHSQHLPSRHSQVSQCPLQVVIEIWIGKHTLSLKDRDLDWFVVVVLARLPAQPRSHDAVDERSQSELGGIAPERDVYICTNPARRTRRNGAEASQRFRRVPSKENVGASVPVFAEEVESAHDDETGDDGVSGGDGGDDIPGHFYECKRDRQGAHGLYHATHPSLETWSWLGCHTR